MLRALVLALDRVVSEFPLMTAIVTDIAKDIASVITITTTGKIGVGLGMRL
jgi:hypothetical protein